MKRVFALLFLMFMLFAMAVPVMADAVATPADASSTNAVIAGVFTLLHITPAVSQWIILVLGALFTLEQYLAGTDRFKANSTFQAIGNGLKWVLGKS